MKISEFLSEIFQFLEVKFSVYLNGCVFLMLIEVNCLSNYNEYPQHAFMDK